MNPWPIIGGVANVVCRDDEFIKPNYGEVGDQIVLTKPLGTQPAVNLYEWYLEKNEKWKEAQKTHNEERTKKAYSLAVESMAHLNINGAKLMKKYKTHGATDITGFGILGHA